MSAPTRAPEPEGAPTRAPEPEGAATRAPEPERAPLPATAAVRPAGAEPDSASAALSGPPWLSRVALPLALLVGAALCTALAGLHLSRAHGSALAWHALGGVLGLLLALTAAMWAGHRARRSPLWARLAIGAALVAVGIAAVDCTMLCWYAFDRVLGGT